jgi:hypothetical protein
MPFSAADALYGFALPALAAAVGCFVVRRALGDDLGGRYAAAVAFAGAFVLGYWLVKLGPWMPEAHWHWLPYAVLLAAIAGPVGSATGVRLFERVLLFAAVALVAAWDLAPNWENPELSRKTQIAAWVALVVVVALLLRPLATAVSGGLLSAVCAICCIAAAVVLNCSGSNLFTQLAGAGAGAMTGVAIAAAFDRRTNALDGWPLPFAVFLSGALWIGQSNSFGDVPLASYVLVSLSPLAMWIGVRGPIAQLTGVKRTLALAALGIALAAVAATLALVAETPFADDYDY